MAFDIDGAKKAGYTDAEIADFLASEKSFDIASARQHYSDAEIIQHLASGASKQTQKQTTDGPAKPVKAEKSVVEKYAGADGFSQVYANPAYRFAVGAGYDPLMGAGQLANVAAQQITSVGGLFPNVVSDYFAESANRLGNSVARQNELINQARIATGYGDGIDVTRLTGNLASPIVAKSTTKIMKALPESAGLMEKVGSGATAGAVGAGYMPVATDASEQNVVPEKLKQVEYGAALGGILPTISPLAKLALGAGDAIKTVAKVLTPNGYKELTIDALKNKVGEKNLPAVIEALKRAEPVLEGSNPTAAEALAGIPAGSPISALQSMSFQQAGGASAKAGDRLVEQAVARAKALSFAGTEQELEAAIAARSNQTQPLYDAVKTSVAKVRTSPALGFINKTLVDNKNRATIASPLQEIKNLLIVATEKGQKLEDNPQQVKSIIDHINDLMSRRNPDGSQQYDVAVLNDVKKMLQKQLGDAVPEYNAANDLFKKLSEPINQMKVGQYLQTKLVNPMDIENPRALVGVVDDAAKLIKKSTGFSRYNKIEDVLTQENASKVKSVVDDLKRQYQGKNPIQKTSIGGNVVAGEVPQAPNILSRPVAIMNAALKHISGDIEEKSQAYLVDLYLNPQELGRLLAVTPVKDRKPLRDAVMKYGKEMAKMTLTTVPYAAPIYNANKIGE